MKYNATITMTQPSCDDPRQAQPLQGQLSEGCVCEENFLLDPGTNTCVQPVDCGCSLPTGYVPVRGSLNFPYISLYQGPVIHN